MRGMGNEKTFLKAEMRKLTNKKINAQAVSFQGEMIMRQTKKPTKKTIKTRRALHRLTAFLLCLCMIISMTGDVGVMKTSAAGESAAVPGPTAKIVENSRVADPDTMDDYQNRLLTPTNGSRYAGRVWTDKTVFAYGDGNKYTSTHFKDGINTITLNMATDGYEGDVQFNSDFAHVFSALASSQVVNEYPPSPVDLVIVFDMSGSMGQDTRYGIDTGVNNYVAHNAGNDVDENGESLVGTAAWPETGVPMADRIANSRIQATLNAINKTIDKLMAQNPQNRVAVCGYGANAVVLMPLGHYQRADTNGDGARNDKDAPYLTVGGMETLYHPSDLVYRKPSDNVTKAGVPLPRVETAGWYWMNNRDTCYTVVVNAETNNYTGILDTDGSGATKGDAYKWQSIKKTVSNNVLTDDGTPVKAFPGAWGKDGKTPSAAYGTVSQMVYSNSSDPTTGNAWAGGATGYMADTNNPRLKNAMVDTAGLKADDYVGYFTNTQGGIYLAYKQLADSAATTYTETLTNGVISTVARIPAAIIMSDGGANFSFNEMGPNEDSYDPAEYSVNDWNGRYGQRVRKYNPQHENVLGYIGHLDWAGNGRQRDVMHYLGKSDDRDGNTGDEWYKVYLPGNDTLSHDDTPEEGGTKGYWNGLHGIYNQGADIFEDGTLSSAPGWIQAGVLYSSDNDSLSTPGAVLEVLLTAAYMNDVVKTHYKNGWTANDATPDSQIPLSTYTMNVDTEHVPQWGRLRLYPTLNPKQYSLDTIESAQWYESKDFGDTVVNSEKNKTKADVYNDLFASWTAWKNTGTTKAMSWSVDTASITINSIATNTEKYGADNADYTTEIEKKNGGAQPDVIHVTDDDVKENIQYNEAFYDVTSGALDETFDEILGLILGKVFVPVSGDNDAGVGDSITYQDPIGEYMEIKNQSIVATPHHIDGKAEHEGTEQTYDMSLLLFGEMHGMVRTGVYDYQWNDAWIVANKGSGAQGTASMQMGWYKGEAASADYGGNREVPLAGGTGAPLFEDPADAWADGWVYRVDYKTLTQYVPLVETPDKPGNLSDQAKNTVYTLYRFSGTSANRNALRRNPIYGAVPTDTLAAWSKAYADAGNQYPDGNELYSSVPGVYRLSDIRVWVEDTGNYVDTEGAITPNSGYDRSLYVNIPAAAIPTELATITLGRDGVLSYETNLGSDHGLDTKITVEENGQKVTRDITEDEYKNFCYQSTPFRLFYAVGLEEDLILRDENGNQTGVNFNAISPEYISSHTVEGQDYVWFISNYYSETRYGEYATDDTSHTRGDPTVTFSPGSDNRYYVFQKPLPLYAHAYRANGDTLTPVDKQDGAEWSDTNNRAGNGKTIWENNNTGGASWGGGQYMGTYANAANFQNAEKTTGKDGKRYITDSSGIKYEYVTDGIVFLQDDLLDHVTSKPDGEGGGYATDSVSFNSNDYFFLLLEFYVPDPGTGVDDKGNEVAGTQKGHMVQYALARKGSEFGSGFASDNIDNGDMLCWTDVKDHLNVEFEYLSKTDTGDLTRGEPTLEKLTYKDDTDLKNYLQSTCGITDPKVLEGQVAYWTKMQEDQQVQAALEAAAQAAGHREEVGSLTETEFDNYFQFAVAARPGGIRSGDMSNNLQYKGDEYKKDTGYYNNNVTKTSNTYYLPTVSDNSGTDDSVIINNYLGNNGRLEIANQMLHVTKMLEPPEGYTLTDDQKNEEFNYQIFVQDVTGTRTAVRTEYNQYSGNFERRLAYIDVLTDNSDLLLTNDNTRALFVLETVSGSAGATTTARQVVQSGDEYYYANEDGTLPTDASGNPDPAKKVNLNEQIYYLYLPSNGTEGTDTQHVRRLYQSKDYDGADELTSDHLDKNGTTTFVREGDPTTPAEPGAENRDSLRPAEEGRPAGTRTYWAMDAELIPKGQVEAAEIALSDTKWEHGGSDCDGHQKLTYQTFLIRRPNDETSETNFTSPFQTRSAYLSVELNFGQNAKENTFNGDGSSEGPMGVGDLYDGIIPSADRPDLFDMGEEKIAASTAEFTLHHGEGLLLTGLDNRITYRITEKLTDAQKTAGYTLKEISHVQQRGSESIYRPGIQQIPIYSYDGATYGGYYGTYEGSKTERGLTWAVNTDGKPNSEDYRHMEPFAHTNAVMWEYYATMEAGASGNHHQPTGVDPETEDNMQIWDQKNPNSYTVTDTSHTVGNNPNCKTADSKDDLREGYCDVQQGDGSILHYMYKDGKLIDPHYNGEASTYMRNMARYGVSPTVHFAVKDERVPTPTAVSSESNDDYTGVYSVFGNTGWFEEQAHYINTFETGDISITKKLDVEKGAKLTDEDLKTEFIFTLELKPLTGPGNIPLPDALPYTITGPGKNEIVEGNLLAYKSEENHPGDIKAREDNKWDFKLKGGQTMTVKGLPMETGYTYTVFEEDTGGYDVVDSEEDETDTNERTVSGTVEAGSKEPVHVTFTNYKKPEPAVVNLRLTKKITVEEGFELPLDAKIKKEQYSFRVVPDKGNPEDDPIKNIDEWNEKEGALIVKNGAPTPEGDETVAEADIFKEWKYAQEGIYVYTVTEQISSQPGVTSDGSVYVVKVDVSLDEINGVLQAELTITKDGVEEPGTGEQNEIVFTNSYKTGSVEVPLRARKEFINGVLEQGMFTFELKGISAEPASGGVKILGDIGEMMGLGVGEPLTDEEETEETEGTEGTEESTEDQETKGSEESTEDQGTGGSEESTENQGTEGSEESTENQGTEGTGGSEESEETEGSKETGEGQTDTGSQTPPEGEESGSSGPEVVFAGVQSSVRLFSRPFVGFGPSGEISEGTQFSDQSTVSFDGSQPDGEGNNAGPQTVMEGPQEPESSLGNPNGPSNDGGSDPGNTGTDGPTESGDGDLTGSGTDSSTEGSSGESGDGSTDSSTESSSDDIGESEPTESGSGKTEDTGESGPAESDSEDQTGSDEDGETVTETQTETETETETESETESEQDGISNMLNGMLLNLDGMPPAPEYEQVPPREDSGDPNVWIQRNTADGWIDFGMVEFKEAGTYVYELREKGPDGTESSGGTEEGSDADIVYSNEAYRITITIEEDADSSALYVKEIKYEHAKIDPDTGGAAWTWELCGDELTFDVPVFINSRKTGKLTVTKTVEGTGGDKNDEFDFTVKFNPPGDLEKMEGVTASRYDKDDSKIEDKLSIKDNRLEFKLKDGESVKIEGLPVGTTYTVTEKQANKGGYATTVTVTKSGQVSSDSGGTIQAGVTDEVKFVNTRDTKYGNLIVTKTVTGDAADPNRKWHFQVELSGPGSNISGHYGDMEFKNGVAEFDLKGGESAVAQGLPADITYTVTETDENQDGYVTSYTGKTWTIPGGGTAEAEIVNHKDSEENKGNLTVSKTVTGDAADPNKEWHFHVELSDTSINGRYGDMDFNNGVAEFTLKHGESATARDLPAGLTYTVKESEADQDGYDTSVSGNSGTIPAGGAARAEYVNHKDAPPPPPPSEPEKHYGGLTVAKTVIGTGGEPDRNWHFRVELSDKSINGQYGGMSFNGGVAELTLKHGESVSAQNLPAGVTYTVTELEAGQDGYATKSAGEAGTIPADSMARAEFVNGKNETPPPPETVSQDMSGNAGDRRGRDMPDTSDSSHMGFWLALMLLSLAGIAAASVLLIGKKKRRRKGRHKSVPKSRHKSRNKNRNKSGRGRPRE